MNGERQIHTVDPDSETRAWWDAANAGQLLLRYCEQCREPHYYPRSICPLCGSDRTQWRPAAGTGTVYAASVTWRAPVPYCIAYVQLDEGPIILSNIVDTDLASVAIGQRVSVVFKASTSGQAVPMFRPVSQDPA